MTGVSNIIKVRHAVMRAQIPDGCVLFVTNWWIDLREDDKFFRKLAEVCVPDRCIVADVDSPKVDEWVSAVRAEFKADELEGK